MISNTAIYNNLVQAYDPELVLYTRSEFQSGPAVLLGRHDTNRVPRAASRSRKGRARRAGMWLTHSLADLLA